LDENSLLEEILFNISSTEGHEEELIGELRNLADLNFDFQFVLMKMKEFTKAKKIIEDNLMIRKCTDPPLLGEEGVVIHPKTEVSFEVLCDCTIEAAMRTPKSPAAIQLLRTTYDSRPQYFPYENER
jgi:hypothetical protein